MKSTIAIHDVLSRKEGHRLANTTADQFLELGSATTAPAEILLSGSGWTLFEFDYQRRVAVFLDVGPEANLFSAAFCYAAQMRLAKRLVFIGFDAFLELSQSITSRHRIVQFYNIGHCGSTLLHHVFNASGEAWDISEPKFLFDLVMQRDALPFVQQVALAGAGFKFLSLYPNASERAVMVVKHFSQCTKIFEVYKAAMPDAKALFMYRDAFGWCNSVYGFAQRVGATVPMPFERRHFLWSIQSGGEPQSILQGVIDFDTEGLQFEDIAACAWMLHAMEFRVAQHDGLAALAFRYNELTQDRAGVLQKVFRHCGLDGDKVQQGLSAFDQDAHAGERSSHDQPVAKLDADADARIAALLTREGFAADDTF